MSKRQTRIERSRPNPEASGSAVRADGSAPLDEPAVSGVVTVQAPSSPSGRARLDAADAAVVHRRGWCLGRLPCSLFPYGRGGRLALMRARPHPLSLGRTAPDAVELPGLQRVRPTDRTHRAVRADGLSRSLPEPALVVTLVVGSEEQRRIRGPARAALLPVVVREGVRARRLARTGGASGGPGGRFRRRRNGRRGQANALGGLDRGHGVLLPRSADEALDPRRTLRFARSQT